MQPTSPHALHVHTSKLSSTHCVVLQVTENRVTGQLLGIIAMDGGELKAVFAGNKEAGIHCIGEGVTNNLLSI